MSKIRTLVVLGSDDAEMREIDALVRTTWALTFTATRGGRRVRPGELADDECLRHMFLKVRQAEIDRVLLVEQPGRARQQGAWSIGIMCSSDGLWPIEDVDIDHHDPAQTWPEDMPLHERSSLGQVARILGVELTDRQRLVGALDHDLNTTIRLAREGQYGGLDNALMTYAQGSAHMLGGVTPHEYVEQAKRTAERLMPALDQLHPEMPIPIWNFAAPDQAITGPSGEQFPLPALPLALAILDRAGLSIVRRADGVYAWRLQCASGAQVERFLEDYLAVVQGAPPPNNAYGQPSRGFAGGVVVPGYLGRCLWATTEIVAEQARLIGVSA